MYLGKWCGDMRTERSNFVCRRVVDFIVPLGNGTVICARNAVVAFADGWSIYLPLGNEWYGDMGMERSCICQQQGNIYETIEYN